MRSQEGLRARGVLARWCALTVYWQGGAQSRCTDNGGRGRPMAKAVVGPLSVEIVVLEGILLRKISQIFLDDFFVREISISNPLFIFPFRAKFFSEELNLALCKTFNRKIAGRVSLS